MNFNNCWIKLVIIIFLLNNLKFIIDKLMNFLYIDKKFVNKSLEFGEFLLIFFINCELG